jgi:hypothetical protein
LEILLILWRLRREKTGPLVYFLPAEITAVVNRILSRAFRGSLTIWGLCDKIEREVYDMDSKSVPQIRGRGSKDLIVILAITTLSIAGVSALHGFDKFAQWQERNGLVRIDELILLVTVGILALAVFSYRRWRELQEAFPTVKTLRGLLPICASCKKIRDDKGYWNQLEVYIQDNFGAKITHGMCPDCAKRLYGVPFEGIQ